MTGNKNSSKFELYLEACTTGAIRGALSLPIEHPFDRIKTSLQINPEKSGKEVYTSIYQSKGIRGFYTGAIPNGTRAVVKNMYRWPLQAYFKQLFDYPQYPGFKGVATGITIAMIETYVITPLERAKVWLMSADAKKANLTNFLAQENFKKELYRGTSAVMAKQLASWVSFLAAEDICKSVYKSTMKKEELSFYELFAISVPVACINTAVVMPFDAVKSRLQREGSHTDAKNIKNVFMIMKDIFKEHGARGLYAGTRWKMVQYFANSIFTVYAMDAIEGKIRNINKVAVVSATENNEGKSNFFSKKTIDSSLAKNETEQKGGLRK